MRVATLMVYVEHTVDGVVVRLVLQQLKPLHQFVPALFGVVSGHPQIADLFHQRRLCTARQHSRIRLQSVYCRCTVLLYAVVNLARFNVIREVAPRLMFLRVSSGNYQVWLRVVYERNSYIQIA